ncbi:MAG: radical SAM protein, partial [Candidatus Methanomethylicaceae archaeon]
IIKGDAEVVIYELLKNNFYNTDLDIVRDNSNSINEYAVRGANIVQQHPYFPNGLICEIETFRGCPRSISGGCSFCIEPLYGLPDFRSIKGIIKEIEVLYSIGVKNFRIGRQPDILIYGSKEDYKPSPSSLKKLFSSIRKIAPNLKVLHIDNVNPSTIYNYPKESEEALKIIVSYHTPGDVAALGIESVDEEVIKRNNLKIDYEGAIFAIELINKIGKERGENGLPHLLPGVNFVYGLPGETEKTFEKNFEFMKEVLNKGLMVRRINLRQVMILPHTRMWSFGNYLIKKHKRLFLEYKKKMREEIDLPMIKRIVPTWTIMKDVRTEVIEGNITWARQIGSYPILVGIPRRITIGIFLDVIVLTHGPRSISAIPIPIKINTLTIKELEAIPNIGRKRAISIIKNRPFNNIEEVKKCLDNPLIIENLIPYLDFSKE